MLKRSQIIALAAVGVLVLILLNLPDTASARLKVALGSLFVPLFGLAGAANHGAVDAAQWVTPKRELIRENQQLGRDLAALRLRSVQAEELARENARLRQLLGWAAQSSWKLKAGQVILRDPANWWRTIQINLGTRDGVRTNLAVLTVDGLVGRVDSVGLTHSQVVLIGDPACRVSALVENETRDMGVIMAVAPLNHQLVELNYLPKEARLKPGQRVVSSGLGGIFPKGIPIGQVLDTRQVEFGISTEARVKLAANLGALEEVWVLWP